MPITVECKCGKAFQLPDNLAGKRGRCPACGEEIQIPAAVDAAPVSPPTPVAATPVALAPAAVQRRSAGAQGIAPVFRIIMLVGAALLFISFFVPWWRISISVDKKQVERTAESRSEGMRVLGKTIDVAVANFDWYQAHPQSLRGVVDDIMEIVRPQMEYEMFRRWDDGRRLKEPEYFEASSTLFGWHSATGIMAFSMGIIVAALVLAPWSVSAARRWGWIPEGASALMMIPLLIPALIWVFNSPMEDIDPFMSQGIIVGPILVVVGCLAILVGGIINGIAGLTSLEKR